MGGGRKWGVGGRGANAAVMSVFSQMDKPVWQASFSFLAPAIRMLLPQICAETRVGFLKEAGREGSVAVGARGFAAWIMAITDGAIFTVLNAMAGRSGVFIPAVSGIDGVARQHKPRLRSKRVQSGATAACALNASRHPAYFCFLLSPLKGPVCQI